MTRWIDADALSKYFYENATQLHWMRGRLNIADKAMLKAMLKSREIIENFPAADVAPIRHGEWIKMSDSDGVYYCCSECGEELYRKWSFDREFDISPKKESIDKTNYCSACGADMRKEEISK